MVYSIHEALVCKKDQIAEEVSKMHFIKNPSLIARFGPAGKEKCKEDAGFHIDMLTEAIRLKHFGLYGNYLRWTDSVLAARNIQREDLLENLDNFTLALKNILGTVAFAGIAPYIDYGRVAISEKLDCEVSFISDSNPYKAETSRFLDLLLNGKRKAATLFINDLLAQGASVKDIYEHIFRVSQYEVGRLWQTNKISVAVEHFCSSSTHIIMSGLADHLEIKPPKGRTMVAAAIHGELHDLGIRMIADWFEMDGWSTFYLGANTPTAQLMEFTSEFKADVLAVSATYPRHVGRVADLIRKIRQEREFADLKILVGGYPFMEHEGLWQQIGADGFGASAQEAVDAANGFFDAE